MRPTKRADRSMEKLAAMLANYGVQQEVIQEVKETAPTTGHAISMQGEAVLSFLESPARFTNKICKWCGESFGTNYRTVAYCCDNCRARAIEKQVGIKWNWAKNEFERWGGEPPLIIPPAALKQLKKFVDFFATVPESQTQTEILPQLPDRLPEESEPDYLPLTMQPLEGSIVPDSLELDPPSGYSGQKPEEDNPFDF